MSLNSVEPTNNERLNILINAAVDTALERENNSQTPREYLGGSRVGVECMRALYYEFTNHPKDAGKGFAGKVIRRFRMGHLHENETADWLRKAGFKLVVEKEDGGQFGFMVGKGKIRGHIDGVFLSGIEVPNLLYPALWEHKVMKSSKFKELKTHGLFKANFVYYAQCQIYMAYMAPVLNMNITHTLFTALNTDTSELHFELIPFDAQMAQWLSDRAVAVVTAKSAEEMPKVTRDPNDFRCKFCSYYKTCWNINPNGAI